MQNGLLPPGTFPCLGVGTGHPLSSLHHLSLETMDIPPQITAAHLLLRGLLPSFLGCGIGDGGEASTSGDDASPIRASAFQMTFRKDLVALGKENGKSRWTPPLMLLDGYRGNGDVWFGLCFLLAIGLQGMLAWSWRGSAALKNFHVRELNVFLQRENLHCLCC